MRTIIGTFAVLAALASASPASAQDRNVFIQGYGGLRLGTVATTDTTFGGVIGASILPNLQVIGEGGYTRDVLPNTVGTLFSFMPVGYHLSALYAQGGLRFTGGSRSAIQPYVETSVGFARLHGNVSGLDSPVFDVITNAGLRLLDRTEPMATAGGGLMIRSGPAIVDLGYRYRRIFASGVADRFWSGERLDTNEVRIGFGFRF